jgi:hypothetical protein
MKQPSLSMCIRTAAGCAVLGVLSACSGGSYHPATTYTPPPTTQGDTFTASVQSSVASAPEDIEPTSVDAIAVTEVDDKEPEAVM